MQWILELYARLAWYPDEYYLQDIHSLEDHIQGLGNSKIIMENMRRFEDSLKKLSLAEMQELYTTTFDLSPVCSPHVGFHLFGESYKRGSFMAQLREEYQRFGMQEGSEIPDHFSYILRYCAELSSVDQELYRELLTLVLLPSMEKMTALFAETTNPYKYLMESFSSWLAEQCASPIH